MAERDVRRTRRVVRHAAVPRSPENAVSSTGTPPMTTPIPAPGNPPASESVRPRRFTALQPATPPPAPQPVVPQPEPPAANPPVAGPPEAPAEADEREAEPELVPLGELRRPELPTDFPTAATLATQDAAAADLRRQLDDLRRQLDQQPPPLSPVRKRDRRPLLGALVVGGTLGAIATGILVPWSNLDLPGHGSAPAASTTQTAARQPGNTAALAPLAAPAGSLPATGPGVSTPGTMMVVQVDGNGTLDVIEHAVLGPRGLRGLTLSLPSMSSLGGAVAGLNPTVRNLRVAVNGAAATATPTADGSGWTVAETAGRARTVQLSYRITDAVVLSRPSDSGRALAVSLPLLGQTLRRQGLPLVVRAVGRQVGGVSCPGAPAAQILCGMQVGNGWTATVPTAATSPLLLLQLNLKA